MADKPPATPIWNSDKSAVGARPSAWRSSFLARSNAQKHTAKIGVMPISGADMPLYRPTTCEHERETAEVAKHHNHVYRRNKDSHALQLLLRSIFSKA